MAQVVFSKPRALSAMAAGFAAAFMSVPAGAAAPDSVADLAAPLLPAVVTISALEAANPAPKASSPAAPPGLQQPPDSLFPDLFNDFFNQPRSTSQPTGQSLGSGFVIDPSGIIVTNNHVIDGADQITVNFTDGSSAPAKVIGIDDKTDIAVLQVKTDHPLATVSFGDSAAVRVGDWVMAVGNPFGFGGTVTLGIVSARNRDINAGPYDAFIQTDAAINKGNSGGPLFNMDGQVIGINTAIVSPSGGSIGIGFAIPAEIAVGVVDQLRQFGQTRRGYLGVRVQAVTADMAQGLGLTTPRGALVAGVDDPGPAASAGLMAGDVILSFGGEQVDAEHDLPRIVANDAGGADVIVEILRNGMQQTLSVKLGQLQDDTQVAAATPSAGTTAPPVAPATPATPSPPGAAAPVLGVSGPLGLTLSDLSAAVRDQLGLSPAITSGVAVVAVDQGSTAANDRIQPGDVIVQVEQQGVTTPADISTKLDTLKQQGQMTAQLVVQNKDGYLRFVNIAIK